MLRKAHHLVLLSAMAIGGCQQMNPAPPHEFQQAAPRELADDAQRPQTARSADPAARSAPENDPTDRAVRAYLADLEAATQQDPPASSSTLPAEHSSTSATSEPLAVDATQTKTNPHSTATSQALTGRDDATTNAVAPPVARANAPAAIEPPAADDGPARPQVLAAYLASSSPIGPVETPPADTLGVHQGISMPSARAPATLEQFIDAAREALAADPGNATAQWRLSLLQLAAGDTGAAAELSGELGEQARKLIARQVSAAAETQRLLADPSAGADQALDAVDAVREVLRRDAELRIPTVALCSRVTTFGLYETMPENLLLPYQPNRVIVYCEVRNFDVEKTSAGEYRALLSSRLELFSDDGRSRWVREEDNIEDLARSRREDFFLTQLVTLPGDLEAGAYTLKVTITDLLASKTNEAVHRFHIGEIDADAAAD